MWPVDVTEKIYIFKSKRMRVKRKRGQERGKACKYLGYICKVTKSEKKRNECTNWNMEVKCRPRLRNSERKKTFFFSCTFFFFFFTSFYSCLLITAASKTWCMHDCDEATKSSNAITYPYCRCLFTFLFSSHVSVPFIPVTELAIYHFHLSAEPILNQSGSTG